MTYEQPNKFTSVNSVTGDLIKSKSDNQSTYANNWELIWGKKDKVVEESEDTDNKVYEKQNSD